MLGLISVPMAMFNTINLMAAHTAVSGADVLSGLTSAQSQSLMMFFINLDDKGMLLVQIFWWLWLFPIATLIYKSGTSKITGHFLVIAGFESTRVCVDDLRTFVGIAFEFWRKNCKNAI